MHFQRSDNMRDFPPSPPYSLPIKRTRSFSNTFREILRRERAMLKTGRILYFLKKSLQQKLLRKIHPENAGKFKEQM